MIIYYAYSIEYGQYLCDTVALDQAATLNIGGIHYGSTDVHHFLAHCTGLVSEDKYARAAMTMQLWQKKLSAYGLLLEKISPIKEKIIVRATRKSNIQLQQKISLTGTVTTKLTPHSSYYEVDEEKIIYTPRGVIIDESEDVSLIHFEKKDLSAL